MGTSASTAAPKLFCVSDFPFGESDQARLRAALGEDGLLLVSGAKALREALATHPETTIVCTFAPFADMLTLAPHLRWLALPGAGAEQSVRAGVQTSDHFFVTNASGIHVIPMREYVFSLLLLWTRNWPNRLEEQRTHRWAGPQDGWRQAELNGATLGIVGLGAIGRGLAQVGHAFGMRIIATRHHATVGEHDPDVDLLLPGDHLHELLGQSDYVVLAVPSTPQTQQLIGAAELQAMRRNAFLVNIARGSVVDELALIEALQAKTIAGAGLDVFAHEPLPPESPLWDLPNVILTSHISGQTNRYKERFTDLFLDNIERFRRGEPLRNVVDPHLGY